MNLLEIHSRASSEDDENAPKKENPLDLLKWESEGESPFIYEAVCELITNNRADYDYFFKEASWSECWQKFTIYKAIHKI